MTVNQDNNLGPRKEGSTTLIFGWCATFIYVAFVSTVASNHWPSKWDLSLFGNFLSGACAPLAFLWLVIATMLQRKELQQNRESMNAQIDEAKHLVTASEASAKAATEASANQSRDERVKRLNELIDLLGADVFLKAGELAFKSGNNQERFFGSPNSGQTANEVIFNVAKALVGKIGNSITPQMELYDKELVLRNLRDVDLTVKTIIRMETGSEVALARIRMLKLPEFSDALDAAISSAEQARLYQPR